MRLLVAALALSLILAVVAAVFAIWPVVADAPWEPESPRRPIVISTPGPTTCDKLWRLYEGTSDAGIERQAFGNLRDQGCLR